MHSKGRERVYFKTCIQKAGSVFILKHVFKRQSVYAYFKIRISKAESFFNEIQDAFYKIHVHSFQKIKMLLQPAADHYSATVASHISTICASFYFAPFPGIPLTHPVSSSRKHGTYLPIPIPVSIAATLHGRSAPSPAV